MQGVRLCCQRIVGTRTNDIAGCLSRRTQGAGSISVDDEECGAGARGRAVRLRVVRNLIAHSGSQVERASISELGVELTGEA